MDALTLLIADHNRVRGLFTRFKAAHEAEDEATSVEVATKIFEELEVHTTIEETVFYPTITDVNDEVHELVVEGLEEHKVAKDLIAETRALSPEDEHWAAKVKVLIESVEHHVEEEETEMFPKLRSSLDAAALESLGDALEAKKAELGAPTLADKIDLTKEELADLASQQEIPGRSKMSREELAATVAPA
jgi:hemerythrin-like domain-containing protein